DRGPGKARDRPDLVFLERSFVENSGYSQELLHVVCRHLNGLEFLLLFGFLAGDLAADLSDLPFKVAQPGLLRVLADDLRESAPIELNVARLQPVLFDLLRNEMTPRYLELLLLGVARKRDYLHAVSKRRLN